jgi:C1A family cysteine protease
MVTLLKTWTLAARPLFTLMGCFLLLAMSLNGIAPVYADDQPSGQEGPVNPAFEAYSVPNLQRAAIAQSEEGASEQALGYMPHPINLTQIGSIPVQKSVKQASTVPAGSGSNAILTGLPGTFDWRTTSKVTPVKNQNPCGTCWLFGSLASLESRVAIVNNIQYDFSEQNVACCVDPAWFYLTGNKCDGGGDSFIAFDTLSRKGTRLEACDPYNS